MEYSRRTSNYLKIIVLSDSTHMRSMVDHVAIDVETLRINSGCSLEKEFIELIHINPLMIIIPNCQLGLFISRFYKWSFDLRHQRHLMDGRSCFDYDLRIPNHEISKTSYIVCTMKCTKMIFLSS